ncbi:MAG: hypothetical protein ACOZAR_01105 [Patescibacteria group bacterium]
MKNSNLGSLENNKHQFASEAIRYDFLKKIFLKQADLTLEKIDFNKIKETYSEYLIKNNLDLRLLNKLIPKELIGFSNVNRSVAEYSPLTKEINYNLSYPLMDWLVTNIHCSHLDRILKQDLISYTFHEQSHALSDNDGKIGFEKRIDDSGGFRTYKKNFELLNEGITKKVEKELLDLYNKKNQLEVNNKSSLFRKIYNLILDGYSTSSFLTDTIISRISKQCDLDQEIVWRVILKGYFNSIDLTKNKYQKVFTNLLPENFFHEFKEMQPWPSIHQKAQLFVMMGKIATRALPLRDKKLIRRWFKMVDNFEEKN